MDSRLPPGPQRHTSDRRCAGMAALWAASRSPYTPGNAAHAPCSSCLTVRGRDVRDYNLQRWASVISTSGREIFHHPRVIKLAIGCIIKRYIDFFFFNFSFIYFSDPEQKLNNIDDKRRRRRGKRYIDINLDHAKLVCKHRTRFIHRVKEAKIEKRREKQLIRIKTLFLFAYVQQHSTACILYISND